MNGSAYNKERIIFRYEKMHFHVEVNGETEESDKVSNFYGENASESHYILELSFILINKNNIITTETCNLYFSENKSESDASDRYYNLYNKEINYTINGT